MALVLVQPFVQLLRLHQNPFIQKAELVRQLMKNQALALHLVLNILAVHRYALPIESSIP